MEGRHEQMKTLFEDMDAMSKDLHELRLRKDKLKEAVQEAKLQRNAAKLCLHGCTKELDTKRKEMRSTKAAMVAASAPQHMDTRPAEQSAWGDTEGDTEPLLLATSQTRSIDSEVATSESRSVESDEGFGAALRVVIQAEIAHLETRVEDARVALETRTIDFEAARSALAECCRCIFTPNKRTCERHLLRLKRTLKPICAQVRNEFSTAQLKEDFQSGLVSSSEDTAGKA